MPANETQTDSLNLEIKQLREEINGINQHWIFQANSSLKRVMFSQFLRGLAFGFGSVIGATIVVSFVGYLLAQLEIVPIIGDWATEIGAEILRSSSSQ